MKNKRLNNYKILLLEKEELEFLIRALEQYKINENNSYINQESRRLKSYLKKILED